MAKYIINKGIAGLGNRLLALSNAIEYAKRTDRLLVVDWTDSVYSYGPSQNAFNDCFRLTDLPASPANTWEIPSLSNLSIIPKMWSGHVMSSPYDVTRYTGSRVAPAWNLEGPFKDTGASATLAQNHNSDIVMFVSYKPPIKPAKLRRHVRLQDRVEREVNDFVDCHFRQPVMGVHVRATDRSRKSGLRGLHVKIALARTEAKDAKLFLSTDNRDVITEMTERYGSSVIVRKKWMPPQGCAEGLHKVAMKALCAKQKRQTLVDAVVDMFLLSRCNFLICHRCSTFSKCAACYSSASHIWYW